MKALTLHEPWASLLATGKKRIETRSWYTPHRGELAVHAGKTDVPRADWPEDIAAYWDHYALYPLADPYGVTRGRIIGTVDLIACVQMDDDYVRGVLAHEARYGNFAPGRYAWVCDNPRVIYNGPLVNGQRGLWEWNP